MQHPHECRENQRNGRRGEGAIAWALLALLAGGFVATGGAHEENDGGAPAPPDPAYLRRRGHPQAPADLDRHERRRYPFRRGAPAEVEAAGPGR